MKGLTRRVALGAGMALGVAPQVQGQAYPAKPIRFLVPYPVGGIVDIVARSAIPCRSTSASRWWSNPSPAQTRPSPPP